MFKDFFKRPDDTRIDYGVILSVFLLALIGMASLYVAIEHSSTGGSPVRAVIMQVIWYVIGMIAVVVIMQFDSEQLWKIAPIAYGMGILLLIAVLFLYDPYVFFKTGAKSWFRFGPFSFQPSEVMKPAYILMLARVVTKHNSEHNGLHTVKLDGILLGKILAWSLPVILLIKLQNDFGTLLVFFAIIGGVILVSGLTWKIIIPAIIGISAIGASALYLALTDAGRQLLRVAGFKSYQFDRIDAWQHPFNNLDSSSLQLAQSLKAIGSGQIFGKGFNHIQVSVPVQESDMIFSVIGENFGFIGSCFVVMLYFILIYQMIKVTFDTKNEFYAYISTGVIMMILFHVFENIGMSIGLLPLTGIPLPFISQGGSALLGNMIGIGFIMSMRYHYKSYIFSEDQDHFHV